MYLTRLGAQLEIKLIEIIFYFIVNMPNSKEQSTRIALITNRNLSKIRNSISHEEQLNASTKINIQTALLWTNSQGMESIKIICHPNTEAISI